MRTDYLIIFLLCLAALTYHQWTSQQEKFYPGAIAPAVPIQKSLSSTKPFSYKKYTIKPQAAFEIRAVVLSAHHYYWGRNSELVPVDLALGWGPMSDGDVLKDISISQGNRWYFFSYQHAPIAHGEIISHSGNMHLIPSSPDIEKKIQKVHKGDTVEFKGYLVNVSADDGWYWNSSQSRADTGDGSCEVIWVNEFEIIGR
jgi:hypothetical protein